MAKTVFNRNEIDFTRIHVLGERCAEIRISQIPLTNLTKLCLGIFGDPRSKFAERSAIYLQTEQKHILLSKT